MFEKVADSQNNQLTTDGQTDKQTLGFTWFHKKLIKVINFMILELIDITFHNDDVGDKFYVKYAKRKIIQLKFQKVKLFCQPLINSFYEFLSF